MMQFVPYTNEEQSVIRRKKRSDWRKTVITMYYTFNKECYNQQAVQVVVNHQGQEEKDIDVENDEPSENEGTYLCSILIYNIFLAL